MSHAEYFKLYRHYKDILNPKHTTWEMKWIAINSRHFDWPKIGLEYYDTTSEGKKFKVSDENKYMHHLMLMKIANG